MAILISTCKKISLDKEYHISFILHYVRTYVRTYGMYGNACGNCTLRVKG